ncbi:MAG: DUF5675 family protein, partial [Bacteroidota bacterium]
MENGLQTIGKIQVGKHEFYTIELPDRDNKKYVSNILPGAYYAKKETHARLGKVIRLFNVPGRSGILIHTGNYYTQIEGCVLVGDGLADLNKD